MVPAASNTSERNRVLRSKIERRSPSRLAVVASFVVPVLVIAAVGTYTLLTTSAVAQTASSRALSAAPVSGEPLVTVSLVERGKAPERIEYAVQVRCETASGVSLPSKDSTAVFSFTMAADATRKLTRSEFPALSSKDACTVTSSGPGTEVFYRSTVTPDERGFAGDPISGQIDNGRYQSAPAQANGRTIEIVHAYTGDFFLSNVVEGVPLGADPTFTFSVACTGDSERVISLGGGDSRLITGLATGATCRVTQVSGGQPRMQDNSGDPSDGVVVIGRADASCWDLRNTTPQCRAVVNVTNNASDGLVTQVTIADETTTTTTTPQDRQQPPQLVSGVSLAAPTAAPATPVPDAGIAFTG